MKQLIFQAVLLGLLSLVSATSFAQGKSNTVKTDTLTVFGNCGQCKSRIEEAAYVKGVKTAEWNKKTKILTVVYNSQKTGLDQIAGAIAEAGHDSRIKIASDKNYKTLPGCCAYRTGTCDHD